MNSVGNVTMSIESYNEMRDELTAFRRMMREAITSKKESWSGNVEVIINDEHPLIRQRLDEIYTDWLAKYPEADVQKYDKCYLSATVCWIVEPPAVEAEEPIAEPIWHDQSSADDMK